MAVFHRGKGVIGNALPSDGLSDLNPSLNLLIKGGVILFQRQDIIRSLGPNLLNNLGLGTHRIDGDDGSAQAELVQEHWNCRDLIGFTRDRDLAQH